jgi:hypothetical protein
MAIFPPSELRDAMAHLWLPPRLARPLARTVGKLRRQVGLRVEDAA